MYKVFLITLSFNFSSVALSEVAKTKEILGDGYVQENVVDCEDKKIGHIEYSLCKGSTKISKIPKAIIVEEPAPKAIIVEKPVLKAIPVDEKELSDYDSIDKSKWPSEHKRCMTLTEEINEIPKATIVSEEVSPECSVVKFDEISCPEGTYTFTSGKSGASIQDGLLRKAKESTDGQGTLPSRSTGSTSK